MNSPKPPYIPDNLRLIAAAAFLLAAIAVSALCIGTIVLLNSHGLIAKIVSGQTASPSTVAAAVRQSTPATDIPVISAVPPTATATNTPLPTATPTVTPTDTPIPATFTPTNTAIPPTRTAPPTPTAKRCVSVVGDSVAHGDAVFEIPGTGYFTAQLAPVSAFIQQQYRQRGDATMTVYNRSASAVGISSPNHPSYFNTVEYAQLLQDGCQYVVIIPWINDLSSGGDPSAAAGTHVQALATLTHAILGVTHSAKIVIVTYYNGAAAPFALQTFASGFTPPAVAMFNQQIMGACSGGILASRQIQCVDGNTVFAGMGANHVMGTASHQALDSIIAAPVSAEAAALLNLYFGKDPNGVVNGDGVHLSNSGKAQLAAVLVPLMP
ncbi:MAG: hypothetical protein ABI947_17690 [Chloroflexota bacterium]